MESPDKDCVLVYLTDLVETDDDFPSKFGGSPVWLAPPPSSQELCCNHCSAKNLLTFLCQIYAPLEYSHSYHRVLYVFYCDCCLLRKCGIKVFRMQLSEQKLELIPNKIECKRLAEEYSITTETLPADEYANLVRKAGREVEEQAEPDDDYVEVDESDEEDYSQPNVKGVPEEREEELSAEMSKAKALASPPTDIVFQTYRKVLHQLSDPVAIYTSQPLMFKKAEFHIKQKRCSRCKGEMQVELQINSTVLSKFQSLLSGDWGAIYIISCKGSCMVEDGLAEEEIELQIEEDALAGRAELQKELERLRLEQKKKEAKREKRRLKRQRRKQQQANNGDQVSKQNGSESSSGEEVSKPQAEEGDWD